MLRSRVFPVLLLDDGGLVKTTKFQKPKYVGDPLNAVRIFNEKRADELTILDIGASRDNCEPNYKLIEKIAKECRMPLCYGGGITTKEQARKIVSLGVEKVSVSSSAMNNPMILGEISLALGAQSVVCTLNLKKLFFRGYSVFNYKTGKRIDTQLEEYIRRLNDIGIGELVINNIDKDGTQTGFDRELIDLVLRIAQMPITFVGGASSKEEILKITSLYPTIGLGVGSLFVFKGKYKAVLINYFPQSERKLDGHLISTSKM